MTTAPSTSAQKPTAILSASIISAVLQLGDTQVEVVDNAPDGVPGGMIPVKGSELGKHCLRLVVSPLPASLSVHGVHP